jgi:hypothetical protein
VWRRWAVRYAADRAMTCPRAGHLRGVSALAACGLVLLHHAGRDAAALADRQAMLLRPGTDITRALPAGRSPPGPAPWCPPGFAGVPDIGREQLAECGGVLGAQVIS